MTVRTLLRLVEPIGVELPVLGQVSTQQGAATVELPGYEWPDDDRDPVRAIPPSSASVAAAHVEPDFFFVDRDDDIGWGACWKWNKAKREATMHVGALLASVEMDESLIVRSDYLHGVGRPEGPAIHQMRLDLDSWRTRFVEWVSLVAGQAVSAATPAIPNNARPDAPNTVVWVEEDGKVAGLPSHQSDRVTVTVHEESEVLGFVVDIPMFERIRDLAASNIEPTTQLRLLRSARVAILRSEYRLALVELGSAAELCLWTVFDRDVRQSTTEERGRWTLGALMRQLHPAGDRRRAELIDGLVDPRNDAVHRAQECDKATALRAFALVRQMVSDELPEPLPTL